MFSPKNKKSVCVFTTNSSRKVDGKRVRCSTSNK